MSIFPAYIEDKERIHTDTKTDDDSSTNTTKWLINSSFPLETDRLKCLEKVTISGSSSSCSTDNETELLPAKRYKKHKKHKKKSKRKKHNADFDMQISKPALEFNGEEEYYIDKNKAKIFLSIRTLHKPACPRYRRSFGHAMGTLRWNELLSAGTTLKLRKRYFQNKLTTSRNPICNGILPALDENEYTSRLGQLNRKTLEPTCDLQVWLDLISLQEQNPYKWTRLLLAERKLDIINRALLSFPRNEQLYRIYIDIINVTYPSFEVTKMIDRLLIKDPHSYTLWTAQIMTTQGSMARCIVPDVLRIYERCMSKMHRAQQINKSDAATNSTSDNIMLKLFNNCALFLRQAGLYELFIALLKLALELNVSTSDFKAFTPLESDQNTLIEYEEIVLQSGLPMNEIWQRIEKLRQSFNFLPCLNSSNDPQRIVFNEDICHYIYPLELRENSFYLMLLILRLLKLPFIQTEELAEKFTAHLQLIGDSDAIEDTLAVCLQRNFAISQNLQNEFQKGLYTLAKEMAVNPTFLGNIIGHDIYNRCVSDLLMDFAASYTNIDNRKRELFIVLWCRFKRLLLVLERCSSKINAEYIKAGRKLFKNLLKHPLNRNVLIFYTEFAIYEYESLENPKDDMSSVASIFENLISSHSADETQASDLCYTYVTFAEMLIGCDKPTEALQVLISFALNSEVVTYCKIGDGKKLAALQKVIDKLDRQIAIEKNVEVIVLEQYLLPDYTISLIKVRMLIQCLIGKKTEAIEYLDKLLHIFRNNNDRHRFLREQIMEIYIGVLQIARSTCKIPNGLLRDKIFNTLAEFPRNLYLLQHCGMLSSEPWFRIRTAILRTKPTILAVTFLIVLARYKFFQMNSDEEWDKRHNALIIRNRILHIFKTLTSDHVTEVSGRNALLRNALFWRLYIRFLSDQCTDFETSKKCLLTALDECPWNKALYLDGATHVPQELSHLQDLIIEKQLRIYALPEELEILREQ
ncbi:protein NRDE2 homolog [Ceratitis capitata]|uniref:Protein NRDE2 n=1 Tax=Ceratitis capitata TaxID=7213 RepID=W8C873_CERCA|nr:protein NRDE2 homolog [Ceratitis capitata]